MDPCTSPVWATVQRLQCHKQNNSPPDIPLCFCHSNDRAKFVQAKDVTLALCVCVIMVKSQDNMTLNMEPLEIDSRSLHSGGATTLSFAKVDQDLIQMQGRWKSDVMIRHLHISASPWVNKFAEQMFKAGNFSFLAEICNDRALACDNPYPNNLPHNNLHHTGDNSHEVDLVQHSEPPSIPSPNLSPILSPSPSSSETSTSPYQANTSPSNAWPSFFSSTLQCLM